MTVSDKLDCAQVRVLIVALSPSADDILFDHKFQPEDVLGLDHMDKGPRRPNPAERAIVIK